MRDVITPWSEEDRLWLEGEAIRRQERLAAEAETIAACNAAEGRMMREAAGKMMAAAVKEHFQNLDKQARDLSVATVDTAEALGRLGELCGAEPDPDLVAGPWCWNAFNQAWGRAVEGHDGVSQAAIVAEKKGETRWGFRDADGEWISFGADASVEEAKRFADEALLVAGWELVQQRGVSTPAKPVVEKPTAGPWTTDTRYLDNTTAMARWWGPGDEAAEIDKHDDWWRWKAWHPGTSDGGVDGVAYTQDAAMQAADAWLDGQGYGLEAETKATASPWEDDRGTFRRRDLQCPGTPGVFAAVAGVSCWAVWESRTSYAVTNAVRRGSATSLADAKLQADAALRELGYSLQDAPLPKPGTAPTFRNERMGLVPEYTEAELVYLVSALTCETECERYDKQFPQEEHPIGVAVFNDPRHTEMSQEHSKRRLREHRRRTESLRLSAAEKRGHRSFVDNLTYERQVELLAELQKKLDQA
jgi:hypothetical protein